MGTNLCAANIERECVAYDHTKLEFIHLSLGAQLSCTAALHLWLHILNHQRHLYFGFISMILYILELIAIFYSTFSVISDTIYLLYF